MHKKLFLVCLGLFLMTSYSFAQTSTTKSKRIRVSGYIYDDKSKETLIGASFYIPKTKTGTTTNNYGFFSLSIPEGQSEVIVSYVGYEKKIINTNFTKDTSLLIYLSLSSLQEVVIEDKSIERRFLEETTPGKIVISPSTITALPSLTGESDLLKSLQLMPGVKSGTEGTSGLYVRGGNVDQNLYLVDGLPIYNPNHLMGFISTFNTDAIKNIEFFKGAFPARYGGRASSVVDVRMKDGNMEQIRGDASIGLISAKLNLEGPIIKDKTTFSISGRRTYIDLITKPLLKAMGEENEFGYYFTDVNAKINHRFSPKNRLTGSLYWGEDKYYFAAEGINSDVKWGNLIGSINWAYEITQRLFSNTSVSYNRYNSKIIMKSEDSGFDFKYTFMSGVEDWNIKNDFNYYLNGWNQLTFGASYTYHTYSPEISDLNAGIFNVNEDFNNKVYGNEFIAYIEDEMNFTEKFSITSGLHLNAFNVQSETYYSLQPRISTRYSFTKNLSFKGGYAMMNQSIHLLANGVISLPTDVWVPITERIKPITSHTISGGFYYQLKDWVNLSADAYYKYLNNIVDYKDGVNTFSGSQGWEDNVAQGVGEGYGLEFMAQREKGNTTGWISYTLSWAYREFSNGEINGGRRYYDRFDSRHSLNITLMHKFSEKLDASASWVFNTGSRLSIPIASYYNIFPIDHNEVVNVYDDRNNYKMPNYHRLDIGLNYHTKTKHGKSTWSLNIYNVYNKKNPVFILAGDSPTKLKAFSIMPIIPTISYTYKFR